MSLPLAASASFKLQRGASELNGKVLKQGDGVATDEQRLVIKASEDSEILWFDLT